MFRFTECAHYGIPSEVEMLDDESASGIVARSL